MFDFFNVLLQNSFLQHAMLAGVLASLGCGVIGTFVVVKRIGYLVGGIAHTVFGGVGVALYFGQPLFLGAIVAALCSALLIGWISLRWRHHEDTLISAVWVVGMGIGVLFIALTPGYNNNVMSYLFGNILLISTDDIWLMAILDLLIVGIVALFYRHFLLVAFDEEFARLRGIPTTAVYLLLLCLVALTVVLLVKVVGLILVIALLALPAATCAHYSHSVYRIMLGACVLGTIFTSGGIICSYQLDFPAGATIVIFAGTVFFVSSIFSAIRGKSFQSSSA